MPGCRVAAHRCEWRWQGSVCWNTGMHPYRMHDFKRLRVWERSCELVLAAEQTCRAFPRSDRGIVSSQLRRAVLSIPANIAEGCGKSSRKETLRFLQIAAGSAKEAESHVLVAFRLGYFPEESRAELLERLDAIQRMLNRLMKNL